MNSKILQSHRNLLCQLLTSLSTSEGYLSAPLKYLKDANVDEALIFDRYDRLNKELSVKGEGPISYLRVFRKYYLEKDLRLHYQEAIIVISEMFRPKFAKCVYSAAVKSYAKDRLIDFENARAEWRAYFEYRFMNALKRLHTGNLKEHWLTVNFNLFSFLEEHTLPIYRSHFGVADHHHPDYKNDNPASPYTQREDAFNSLSRFQGKYSTVWEIVKNNISTIFYFDKTPEKEHDMIIYEIDPDVQPGIGQVDPKYVGKFVVDESHRSKPLLESAPSKSPESIFRESRLQNREQGLKERAYQYSIIRFFIRAGIFNPQDAASATLNGLGPIFQDILKMSFDRLKQMRDRGENCCSESNGDRKSYEMMLFDELSNETWETIKAVADKFIEDGNNISVGQFKSSQARKRLPYQDDLGRWYNFDYSEKYSQEEDVALDKVIALIDLVNPEFLDVRLSIFEAGFSHLTQKDNTISHVYWIPIVINWRNQVTGGAAFLNSDKRIDPNIEWEKDEYGYYKDGSRKPSTPIMPNHEVPQSLLTILYYITGIFADKLIGEIEESIRPTSERAAAVSIMSRNISHNIGSHVLSYLKHLLGNEPDIFRNGVLENLVEYKDGHYRINPDVWGDNNTLNLDAVTMPYLRSIGRLLGYFQERQDYIGTFASDRYLYFSPIYFKKSVMDYFSGETVFKSVNGVNNGEMRNLALDFIIFSEGYKEVKKDIRITTEWQEKDGSRTPISNVNDLEIALPSGNTGRQGIFTILENFIRNSAKHGLPKKDRPNSRMEIKVTLADHDDDFFKLQVRDNSGKTDEKVVKEIQDVLDKPLLRADGTPDERHKGIKEIQIAAAWIRGIHPHQLLDQEVIGKNKIVEVENVDGDLRYTLFLRKPKPGLLLVNDDSRYWETDAEGAKTLRDVYKVSLKDWEIFQVSDQRGINPRQLNYRFVLIHDELAESDEEATKAKYQGMAKRCPARWLSGGIDDVFLTNPNLIEAIYQKWLDTPYQFSKKQQHRFDLVTANYRGNPSDLKICIADGSGNILNIDPNVRSKILTSSVKDENNLLLFREHNDLPGRFDELRKENSSDPMLNRFLFIEGISGSNSTDRIIRHERINNLWRYKMIEAALTKIIIIDERIWNNQFEKTREEREQAQLRWAKKNIHIFSLEYDPDDDNVLCLKDLCDHTVVKLDRNGHSEFTDEKYREAFRDSHFISFHQGLLERALKHCSKAFGHKTEEEQVDEIFTRFRNDVLRARFRVLIHSGRSKTHIMPAPTAFVQLSALGSALRDCKLTLCELFYSTILENNE